MKWAALALAIGFGVLGSGFRVRSGSGFLVRGSAFSVPGSGFGVGSGSAFIAASNEPGTQNSDPRSQSSPLSLRVGLLRPGGGYTISSMAMDAYVARVLAGEAVRDSQPAALEALAIAIRTFALANRGRHRADGFDLCGETHCQVVRAAVAATERAARATSGRVLMRGGLPAQIFFSASCGGRTEIPSEVWPGAADPSYLPSKDDDGCGGLPVWTAELHTRDLQRALRASGFRGDLHDVRIAARNRSGRVSRLKLDGLHPDQISGQDLRVVVGRTLGWQHVKSTAFELRRQDDVYRFSGHGSGHGVGMCVIGSAKLAERGLSPDAILARYFPGLAIRSIADVTPTSSRPVTTPPPPASGRSAAATRAPRPSPILVSLPDEDEGQRQAIEQQTLRARDELAAKLGVPAPASVTLRFHPTTDDYERATGQPWFTSATVVANELHLLPLAVLRERGVLERTLRHELVHIMTDSALANRRRWVREGAAIYFAGEQTIPGEIVQRPPFKPSPRASCPDDNELLRPVSVGALSNAYARARTCFARQIEAGRSWKDVR